MIIWLPLLKSLRRTATCYPISFWGAADLSSRWTRSSLVVCLMVVVFFFFLLPLTVRRQAHLCVLAANCDEPMYVKLVEALCAEHQINLMKVRVLGPALPTQLVYMCLWWQHGSLYWVQWGNCLCYPIVPETHWWICEGWEGLLPLLVRGVYIKRFAQHQVLVA